MLTRSALVTRWLPVLALIAAIVGFPVGPMTVSSALGKPAAPKEPSKQEAATPPKPLDAESSRLVEVIAPWVADDTIAVLYCNLAKGDVGVLFDFLDKTVVSVMLASMPAAEGKAMVSEFASARVTALTRQRELKALGVVEVVMMLELSNAQAGPIVLIPLSQSADAKRAIEAVSALLDFRGEDGPKEMTVGGKRVLVFGRKDLPAPALTPTQAARQRSEDLVRTLTADGTSRGLPELVIGMDVSAPIRERLAALVPLAPVPGSSLSTRDLIGMMRIGHVALRTATGKVETKFRVGTADESTATKLVGVLTGVLKTQAAGAPPEAAKAMIEAMTPKQDHEALEFGTNTQQTALLMGVMLPALGKARQAARLIKAQSEVRLLIQSVILYAKNNKDTPPDSLTQLIEAKILKEDTVPSMADRFAYIKPTAKSLASFSADFPCIYLKFDTFPRGGIPVGFLDGHVDVVLTEAEFKSILAKTTKTPPAPAEKDPTSK